MQRLKAGVMLELLSTNDAVLLKDGANNLHIKLSARYYQSPRCVVEYGGSFDADTLINVKKVNDGVNETRFTQNVMIYSPQFTTDDNKTDGYVRASSMTDGYVKTSPMADGYVRAYSMTDGYVEPQAITCCSIVGWGCRFIEQQTSLLFSNMLIFPAILD
jgi:hypothetical protein